MGYILVTACLVLSLIVQAVLNRKFDKYSRITLYRGLTGAEVARAMLQQHGITDVRVEETEGFLTDHYDPREKVVRLSGKVYSSDSVAAAAVAAHECGHAVQHARGYAPLRLRTALVPTVNFASRIVSWVLLAGILTIQIFPGILWFAIALFAMTTLFSIVTLPVETNASRKAVAWLDRAGIVEGETKTQAQDALKWAAYTYVVAALSSLVTLFYYIGIARRS